MKKNKFISFFLVCLIVLFSFPFSVTADVTWKFVDQSVYKYSNEAKAKLEACTVLPTSDVTYKFYVISHDSSDNLYYIGLVDVFSMSYIKAVSGKSNGIPYFVFKPISTSNVGIYKLNGSSWDLITNAKQSNGFYASTDLSTVEGYYLGDHVLAVSSTTYSQVQSLLTWMRSIYDTDEEEVIPGNPDYGADIEDLNNKYYEITQSIKDLKSELNSMVQEAMSNLQDNLSTVLKQLHTDNVTINNNISSLFGAIRDNIVPSLGSIDSRLLSLQEKLATLLVKLDIIKDSVNLISDYVFDINTKFDITLSSFRDSVINEFTSLKTQITNLFTSLQNQLDERFNETYNVIMYGNKEGTYEHPELQNKLSEYDSNLESINTNISSASSSITSAGDNVASYISGFTELYTGLTNVVGFGAIITFGLAIIFVKKVIGR